MNTPIKLRQGVVQQAVGDVLMLMDAKQGRYLELNETGAVILNALLEGATAEQAAAQLSASYQVGHSQALKDVNKLTDDLMAAQLLDVSE